MEQQKIRDDYQRIVDEIVLTNQEREMPRTKSLDQLYAEFAALEALCLSTGKKPSEIKPEWVDKIASSAVALGGDAAEHLALKKAVTEEAMAFFEKGRIFPKEKMKVYLGVKDIFTVPLAKQNEKLVHALRSKEDILSALPKGLVQDIYLEFLSPYAFIARNSWLSSIYYGSAGCKLLRQHFSRFVQALDFIAVHYNPPTESSSEEERAIANAELALICDCLRTGLHVMHSDLKSFSVASELMLRGVPVRSLPTHEIVKRGEGEIEMVLITSTEPMLTKLQEINDRLTMENAKLRALLEAKGETTGSAVAALDPARRGASDSAVRVAVASAAGLFGASCAARGASAGAGCDEVKSASSGATVKRA